MFFQQRIQLVGIDDVITFVMFSTVASTVERDALAQSREELAGAVVRVGRDADDQLAACQAVVLEDRK